MCRRSVHWFWFPLLAVALVALRYIESSTAFEILISAAINIAFLFAQLLLVTIYFSVKQGRLINITKGLLGWGDILLIVSIAFYLSSINFIFFYIISLVVVLLGWLTYIKFISIIQQQIPLAGLQAILFALVLITSYWNSTLTFTNNGLLIELLSR